MDHRKRKPGLELTMTGAFVLLVCAALAATDTPAQQPTPEEWQSVERAFGKSGAMQPGEVFKFSLPRSDMKVTVRGVQIKPGLALGS
jgi:hypothetical protein